MSSRVLLVVTAVLLGGCDLPDPDPGRRPSGDGDEGEGEGEDVVGDGDVGDDCSFNADCGEGLRCGCVDGSCACEAGERGTGRSGVDVCVDGNDCATSLCVEGDGDFFCSGPCADENDCGPALPVCADIAFVGRVCIREAPAP